MAVQVSDASRVVAVECGLILAQLLCSKMWLHKQATHRVRFLPVNDCALALAQLLRSKLVCSVSLHCACYTGANPNGASLTVMQRAGYCIAPARLAPT